MTGTRLRNGLVFVAFLWDSAWKFVAVARAVQNRQFKWIPPLLLANTLGLLPIAYLKLWGRRPSQSSANR